MDWSNDDYKEVFPPGTKIINICGTREKFEAVVRCRCRDKDEFFESWLKPFQFLNNVGLRTSVTRPRTGKIVLYKAVFRCQHNTYPKSHLRVKKSHKKHTDCPAIVRVTIKAPTENRRVRDKDKLRSEFPTLIAIIHNHNHNIKESKNIFLHTKANLYSKEIYTSNKISKEFSVSVNKNILDDHEYNSDLNTIADYVCEETVKTEKFSEDNHLDKECCVLNANDFPVAAKNSVSSSTSVPVHSWSVLKEKFHRLLEKWEVTRTVEHYDALQVALLYLENHEIESSGLSSSNNRQTTVTKNYQNSHASGIVVIEFPKLEMHEKVKKQSVVVEKPSQCILSTDTLPDYTTGNENLTVNSVELVVLPDVKELQTERVNGRKDESLFLREHRYMLIDGDLKKKQKC